MNLPFPKRVAILYSDAKREYFPTQQLYLSEAEVEGRARLISQVMSKMGIATALFPGDDELTENLKKFRPDFVLNLVDSVRGDESLAATISATLELLHIPYTGAGLIGQAINANKFLTKNLIEQWGITTPKYQLVKSLSDPIDPNLDYPIISKLNEAHGSIEIDENAVSTDKKHLQKRINFLIKTYHQPVLLEEFIVGREVSAVVLQGLDTRLYAAEKIFGSAYQSQFKVVSFNTKWVEGSAESLSIDYQKYELPASVKKQLATAFEILRMDDYARFDLRVDQSGRHYVIDCNVNPAIGPKECDTTVTNILNLYGITFTDMLKRLIDNTVFDISQNHNHSSPLGQNS